ncbi:DUF481 domain-containing protein [Bdellovibrio sp. HCB209]|uniref:DUF481 domain-containing protein n=1 Tax=Bdellovibrio sp. HCB209 TaxID=3394354 RepID=UPI0039B69679
MVLLLIALASLIGMQKSGVSTQPLPLHLELDAGVLAVRSKNNTQSINTNLDASYDFGKNTLSIYGGYLKTSTQGTDSALHWLGGARYDYEFMPQSRVFLDYNSEADPFIGYVQRNNESLGYSYIVYQKQNLKWWMDFAYLHSKTDVVRSGTIYESKAFFATYTSWKFTKDWSLDGWFQLIPNFTTPDQDMINYQFSVTSIMNPWISLRGAYLVRYIEQPYLRDRYQTLTTLSLVSSF